VGAGAISGTGDRSGTDKKDEEGDERPVVREFEFRGIYSKEASERLQVICPRNPNPENPKP